MPIRSLIRTIPDFPRPGIQFRDITTLLKDPRGLALAVEGIRAHLAGRDIDKVAGIESRGFIVGAPLAMALGVGFVPIRKPGKLPGACRGVDYQLEYGSDRVEMHDDAVAPGEAVLLIDDLIATGGTALAAAQLLGDAGARIVMAAFVVELPALHGRARLESQGLEVVSLCTFDGH